MKIIKVFSLVIICILLLITMGIFQTTLALKATMLSPDGYKQAISGVNLKNVILESTKNKGEVGKNDNNQYDPELEQILEKSVDKNWLDRQTSVLIDGTFNFLEGRTQSLPVIDIKEFKDKIINNAVNEELKKQAPAGLKVDKAAIRSQVETETKIPDKLDLKEYLKNTPDEKGITPLDNIRTLYNKAKGLPFLALAVSLLLAVAVIAIAFNPSIILKWLGTTLLLSGVLSLLSSKANAYQSVISNVDKNAQPLVTSFFNAFLTTYSKEAIVITILGVILLAVGFIPHVKQKSRSLMAKVQKSPKIKTIKAIRVLVALLMLISVPVFILIYSVPVVNTVTSLSNNAITTNSP